MQFVVLYIGFVSLFASTADAGNYKMQNCGTKDINFADYRGDLSETEDGKECQPWSEKDKNDFPDSGLDNNHCRNPDGDTRAWCYTSSSGPGMREKSNRWSWDVSF